MNTLLKTIGLFLLTGIWMSATASASQPDHDLSYIISQHIEAHGGAENLSKIHALEFRGQFTGFSVTHGFRTVTTADGYFFTDYVLGKHGIQEGFDGADYWTIDPWQGFDFARKINKAERHVIMQKSDIVTPFFNWKEKSYKVAFAGREMTDGLELLVLTLERPGMPAEKWYLDPTTYLPVKYLAPWVDFTVSVQAETIFDDYREIHGVVMPFYVEKTYSTRHTVTEIHEVELNPVIDRSRFSMPDIEASWPLKQLCQNWSVAISMMTRSGQWAIADSTTTHFTVPAHGRVQAQLAYDVAFPVHATYTLSYNKRTLQYQMVLYQEMFGTTDLYTGEMESDTIYLYPHCGAEVSEGSPQLRYALGFPASDQFYIHRERSTDAGQSWTTLEKLSFSAIE